MMNKKSQAALEFIMTYGWAILVVLVAIGALAYFGVLNPDRFLPSKCTLQSGIACLDHKATATTLTVVAQNSLGFDITVTDVKASQCTAQTGLSVTVPNGAQYPVTLCCGAACSPTSLGNVGTKYNGVFNITYTVIDTGLSHVNQGAITTRIE